MTDTLPARAAQIAEEYPEIWKAYQGLGQACAGAGPLDERTRRLVKLALAIGGGSEGAVHSQARRGIAEGIAPNELRHVALLAISTLGFPRAVAAMSWVEDILNK